MKGEKTFKKAEAIKEESLKQMLAKKHNLQTIMGDISIV